MSSTGVVYAGAGTYNLVVPAGVTCMFIPRAIGAGGGGAGGRGFGAQGGSSGGAAGELRQNLAFHTIPGNTLVIVVPAGGAGSAGVVSANTVGGNGAHVTIDGRVIAKGGDGGIGPLNNILSTIGARGGGVGGGQPNNIALPSVRGVQETNTSFGGDSGACGGNGGGLPSQGFDGLAQENNQPAVGGGSTSGSGVGGGGGGAGESSMFGPGGAGGNGGDGTVGSPGADAAANAWGAGGGGGGAASNVGGVPGGDGGDGEDGYIALCWLKPP